MEHINLGRSDLHVTRICLGTMTFGAQTDEGEAHRIMDAALDMGINFFDTAEMYAVPPTRESFGKTEVIIGNWFEKRPGACIMSAHRALDGMNFATATQWVLAMQQAAKETIPHDPDFVDSMVSAFASMSKGMAANAGKKDDH